MSSLFPRIALLTSLLALVSGPALAQSALIFERTQVKISAAATQVAPSPAPLATLDVELRSEDALRLEYIHALNTLTPNTGVMIYFATPTTIALPTMRVYTPVDAVFVEDTGRISQIAPGIVLGEMTQEVIATTPVKAFLFIKAGEAARLGLKSGYVVTARPFSPSLTLKD